jgi:predicted acyl esterase/arylsulfatase A-like enzyme
MSLKKILVFIITVVMLVGAFQAPGQNARAIVIKNATIGTMFAKTSVEGITTIVKGTNGVAIADFNRDGLMDFLDANSPPRSTKNGVNTMRMLIGKGNMTYQEQLCTLEGTTLKFENMGLSAPQVPVVADFNRDGFLDIFVTRNRGRESKSDKIGNQLLVSNGSFDKFTDMSEKMGIRNIEAYNRQPSLGDINGDGWLDIAVGADNISKASYAGNPESRVYIFQPQGEKFEDGTFRDISDDTSLLPDFSGTFDNNPEKYRGGPDIDLRDLDNDGDLDLAQAYHNDMNTMGWETHDDPGIAGKQHFGIFCWKNMFKEEGKFRFSRIKDNGLATEGWCIYNKEKQVYEPVQHSIGVPYLSFGDADNDGLDDVINVGPTHSSWHVNSDFISGQYWKNLGNFKFRESTNQAGLEALNWTYGDWHKFWKLDAPEFMTTVKEGTKYKLQPGLKPTPAISHQPYLADVAFGDFDNDGWQDFVLCDRSQRPSVNFRNVLFRNDGNGKFSPVEWQVSGIEDNSICTEVADLNNDGLLDLFFAADPDNSGLATRKEDYNSSVYINTGANGARENHWIRMRFSGLPDSEIIGGKAVAYSIGNSPKILGSRQISVNQSYKSGSSLEAHFGLSVNDSIDLSFVTLSGKKLSFRNLKADNYYDLNLTTFEVKPAGPVSKDSDQATSAKGKPNIIFFLVDDLDLKLDTMKYAPKIKKHMADAGATFTQFFISNTLCCPSRSTIQRGQFSHNNKVLTNGGPDGGFQRFLDVGNEDSNIATWLQASGYSTVFMGKYLNGYPNQSKPTHVPKGWSEWFSPAKGNAYGCYNYTMNENGKLVEYGSDPDDHINDVMSVKAVDFISRKSKESNPFFAYISSYSPHSPATPAKRHEKLFPNLKAPRTPNFNEEDVSDKPGRIGAKKKLTDREIAGIDRDYGLRVRSMQSVDDMVENVVKALEKAGQIDNTYLVFISDNGFHLGQHRLPGGKGTAYEEDILVPCYIRGPGIKAGSTVSEYLTGNVDLASTFADMADVTSPDFVDGRSILPLAKGEKQKTWRNAYFIEFYPFQRPKAAFALMKEGIYEDFDADEDEGRNTSTASYIAIRTKTHTYIEHQTGEKEFYDINKDPWQLENQAEKTDKSLLAKYSAWTNQLLKSGGSKLREIEEKTLDSFGDVDKKPYESFLDIVYKVTDADKNLTSLDIYTPDKNGKNAVLVWIHGGSWSEGDKKTFATSPFDMPKVFCAEKYVVVSVNYRLSPAVKFPTHPQDVASAIAWVKANIAKYGGDPARINLAGHSAGAHLTALVSTDERFLKAVGLNLSDIKSAVPSDAGTYDFIAFANRQKEKKAPIPKNFIEVFTSDEKVWKEASPIYYVEKGKKIPPMLLFYSKGSKENPNNGYFKTDTEIFAKKLTDNGFTASTHGAPELDHGQLAQSYCNPNAHTTKAFLEFLKKHNVQTETKDDAFTRTALQIPMRDSKNLAADLYSSDTSAKKPTILVQTPYDKSKYWTQLKQRVPFSLADYSIVILDWRGRFASKDAASSKASTGQDGYDAVEWIAKQAWSNGKIGTYGGSALGDVQFKTASQNPPHLVCAVPMVKDFKVTYEQFYFGGEYRKEQTEALQNLGFFETKTILAQPIYNQFWKTVESKSDISASIKVPMLMISGWFDHYPDQVLRAFADIQTKSNASVKTRHKLIFGPWEHGNLDAKKQGILDYENAVGFGDKHAVMFMDFYLLGKKNNWEAVPTVQYYQMGDEAWKNAQSWDTVPRNEVSYYLNANKTLTLEKPASNTSSLAFSYDPKDPTPSFGGKRFDPTKLNLVSGPQDQKTIEARKDVLVFSSNPLNADLQINGLVKAQIFFSSNQADTDISVRFCDVYPDGKSVLMAEGIQRARFRNSLEKEEFLTPGSVYRIDVKLQNLALTVKKGHKIRVIVSSASYPIFDRNPNNGGKLYTDNTLNIAINKVFFGKDNLSRIILPALKPLKLSEKTLFQSFSCPFLANMMVAF